MTQERTGPWTIPGDRGGHIAISNAIHDRMHQALAMAGRQGLPSIPCEAVDRRTGECCAATSGNLGPIDTRLVESMLQAAASWEPDPADQAYQRPVQPHRRYLYPELPAEWVRMTFASYIEDASNADIKALAESWAETPDGVLVLLGQTGVGKSHLVAAIAQDLLARGVDVSAWMFDAWHDALRGVFAARDASEIEAFRTRMINAGVLVIDDVRAEPTSQAVREMFERVVDRRVHEKRPLLIATNATEEEWTAWSARAYSRLRSREYATWIPIVDRDRRLVA